MLKMQVIGHLGRDASTNTVNGKTVINFTVAHSEKWKSADGTAQERTTWVDCSWWTDRTAIVPYLKKGTQVYVEGQPEARAFQKKDGTPGSSLSVRVGIVQLLGSSGGDKATPIAASEQPAAAAPPAEGFTPVEDTPF